MPDGPEAEAPAPPPAVPKVLYTPEEVAAMFGRSASWIRGLCRLGAIPYRIETTWSHRTRKHRRIVFSVAEIQAVLDYFAPRVEVLQEQAAARLAAKRERNALRPRAPDSSKSASSGPRP